MNIAIFGGSFNPPHIGHLWALRQLQELKHYDSILMMPCYSGEASNKKLQSPKLRQEMCKIAMKEFGFSSNVYLSDLEIKFKFTHTYQTAQYFSEKFSNDKIHICVGNDWDWKHFKCPEIIRACKNVSFDYFCRKHIDGLNPNVLPWNFALKFELSSSTIRERIKLNLPINNLVTLGVEKFIKQHKLYED